MLIKFFGGPLDKQTREVEDNVTTFKVANRVMKKFKFESRPFDVRVATIEKVIYTKGGIVSGIVSFIYEPMPANELQVYIEDK